MPRRVRVLENTWFNTEFHQIFILRIHINRTKFGVCQESRAIDHQPFTRRTRISVSSPIVNGLDSCMHTRNGSRNVLLICFPYGGRMEISSCFVTLSPDLIKAGQHGDQCSCLPDELGPQEPCLPLKPCLTQLLLPSLRLVVPILFHTRPFSPKPCRPTRSVDHEPSRLPHLSRDRRAS